MRTGSVHGVLHPESFPRPDKMGTRKVVPPHGEAPGVVPGPYGSLAGVMPTPRGISELLARTELGSKAFSEWLEHLPYPIPQETRTRLMTLAGMMDEYRQGHLGGYNQLAWVEDTSAAIQTAQPIKRLIVNMSGLKFFNDIFSHPIGDQYVQEIYTRINDFFGARGIDVRIYQRGPNFEIDLPPETEDLEAVMQALCTALQEQTVEIDFYSEKYKDDVVMACQLDPRIAAYTHERGRDGPVTLRDIRMAGSRLIGRLNAGEGRMSVTAVKPQAIAAPPEADDAQGRRLADLPDWKWGRDILVDKIKADMDARGIADPQDEEIERMLRMRYVEPDSGFFNRAAFDVISVSQAKAKKREQLLSVAFFDVNKMGAFRQTFGFAGDMIIDAIICQRIPEAAREVLARQGIMLFRSAAGSEEFYVLGNVSAEKLQTALQDFCAWVNRPLKLTLPLAERKQFPVELVMVDQAGREWFEIDVMSKGLIRGGRFSGFAITAAVKRVVAGTDVRETVKKVAKAAEDGKTDDRQNVVLNLSHEDGLLQAA